MHSPRRLQQSNPSTRQRDQRIPGRKRRRIQNRSPQEGDHALAQQRDHPSALHHHHPLCPTFRGPHHPKTPPALPRAH